MKKQKLLMLIAVVMSLILAAGSVSAATMSASSTAPAINGYDIANNGDVTGTDKWFNEDSGAGAVKGQTFITGDKDVALNSITYQVADTSQAEATKTYVIRVGTVTGDIFTEIYREEATQDFMWNSKEYMTWTFDLPVLLNAGSEYGIDVGMTASTSGWQTGIPYINMTANDYADGFRYTSGTSGIGTDTIALDGSRDRIFHLDISSAGPEVLYPKNGEVVPAGDVTLQWINLDDPCSTDPVKVDVWFGTEISIDPNNPGDFTKLVSAQNINSFTVSPAGPGIYYWQVNTDLSGPNVVEGAVYMFTNDAPIESASAGPDMVTWTGQPVDMLADIDDDGASPLTYLWTVDPMEGVTITGADTATPALTVTKDFSKIKIANPSFEELELADGAYAFNVPGWSGSGIGSWNPGAAGTAYPAYDATAPDGENVVFANGGQSLSQVLSDTLTEETTYTLSVKVGKNAGYATSTYKVELMAGDNVLAEDDNTMVSTTEQFFASEIVFDSVTAEPNKIGLPLQIRLSCTGPDGGEFNFDDVQLSVTPERPVSDAVSTVTVTLQVNDETNPVVTDTMTIDIYDTPCIAARVGVGLDLVTDYDGNCVVSVEDLATMAGAWLADTSQKDVIFGVLASSVATTMTGGSDADDGWNNAGNWDAGVPEGSIGVVIAEDVIARVKSVDTPAYVGSLTLSAGSTLKIDDNGTDGDMSLDATVIIMNEGSSIDTATRQDPHFPTIYLAGNATFKNGSNAADNDKRYFDGPISGPGTLTIEGRNGTQYHLTTATGISELVCTTIDRWHIYGKAAGCFGSGNVTILGREDGRSAQVHLDVADTIADTATLTLNGSGFDAATDDRITIASGINEVVGKLIVSGSKKADGVYDNTEAWLSGDGTLEVITPEPTDVIVEAGGDVISWSGKEFTLAPTVADPNHPEYLFDYSWTAGTVPGMDVVISDPTAETPIVTVTRFPAWIPVTIPNASFEERIHIVGCISA